MTPSSDPSEYKKFKNRQYARKSREKKSNEIKVLRERCLEQEAIIEIYKKTLSIFHAKEAGLSPTWSMRQIQWFPSQAPRHNPPIIVKCYLPEYDDKFFSELGNNAYGQLFQPTEVKPADVTDQPVLESLETKPPISFANSSSPCDKYALQTTISSTSYKEPASMPCPSPPLPTKSTYLPSEKNSVQATPSTNPDMTDPLYTSPYVFVDQSQILNQGFIPHMKTETGLLRQLKEEEFHKLIAGMDQNQTADNGSTFNLIYLSALPENLKKASMDTSSDGTNEVTQTAPDNAKQMSLNHQDLKFFLRTPDKVKKEQSSSVSPAPIVTNSPWMVSKKDCIPGIFSSKASEITAALLNGGNSTRKAQMIKTQVSSGPSESNITNLHNDTDTLSEEELKLLKMVDRFAKVPAVSQPFSSTQQNASRLTPTVVSSNGIPATTNIPNVSMLIDSFSSAPSITSHGSWHKANECKAIYTNSRVPSHQSRKKESEHFLKSHILHSLYAATTYPQTSSVAQQPFEVLAKTTADSLSCTAGVKNSVESISGGGNISNTHQPQKIAALAIARSSVTPKTCLSADSAVLTSLMSSVPDSETFIINEKPCQTSHAEQKPANSPNESSCYAHISTNTSGLGSLSSFVLENINVDLESLKSTLPDET
ncbi:hypothetical protein PoB_006488700 [Plakobranchus ocellatus]|uniref:BZIP domain-containing protein n=1 Tax=Plakobranchus ocellatus TaxID=259542 RepID=A0AAV4D2I3_9GAST|nr:hypothetical protein PoB_006488700 [Plakobranchus ocellatus]